MRCRLMKDARTFPHLLMPQGQLHTPKKGK
jgi:hypothetical protein